MADFNIRSDSVNVEQIMEQIRARIRDKRGVDYTEQQIQDLAAVKLEKFLDPRGVRSDLLEEFRRMRPPVEPPVRPNYVFNDSTLFETHRAPIRWIRRLLLPILKLFFNPNPLIQALHIQSQLNTMQAEAEAQQLARGPARDQLTFEVMHNLVVETTRMGIEVKSLKMRVESLSSRLEFNERRARALESAVVYKPAVEQMADRGFRTSGGSGQDSGRSERVEVRQADSRPRTEFRPRPEPTSEGSAPLTPVAPPVSGGQAPAGPEGPGQRSRRRRRRRGRRSGPPAAVTMGEGSLPAAEAAPAAPSPADQAPSSPASEHSANPASPPGDSPHAPGFGSGGSEPDSQ
jgi:hypothetical protein